MNVMRLSKDTPNKIAVLTYKVRKFATWYGTINNIKIERYGSRNNGIFRKA